MVVKHVVVEKFDTIKGGQRRSRFALTFNSGDGWIAFHQLDRQPPAPASAAIIMEALQSITLSDGRSIWERAIDLHGDRQGRYRVEKVSHPMGSIDFYLRVEADANLGDFPRVAKLHISGANKFNFGLGFGGRGLWVGDLIAFLENIEVVGVLSRSTTAFEGVEDLQEFEEEEWVSAGERLSGIEERIAEHAPDRYELYMAAFNAATRR